MSEADLTVRDYRVAWPNYHDFVTTWLRRFVFGRANLIRFVVYALVLGALTILPLSASIAEIKSVGINGTSVEGVTKYMFVSSILITVSLFSAVLAYVVGPLIIYLFQTAKYFLPPLRNRTYTLTLSPEGLQSEGVEARTPWEAVHSVHITRKTVLIFTRPSSAIIVPKAAFASQDDAASFANAAEQWWKAART